jgi:hypothetical protein
VGADYVASTPGASAILPQAQPRLDPPGDGGHSLAELTVQADGQRQTVEVGWTVDSAQGDLRPHLFVFAWVNGKGLGYDCCGYVQTGRTWAPGDHVKPGASAEYGISLWHGRFTRGMVSQAFGEVASNGRTGTQMIDGQVNERITNFRLLGARTPSAHYYAPKSHRGYRMGSHGRGWFYLGGPGY